MDLEELLVSGAPARVYSLAGSLFEFHRSVMDESRAQAAGIHALFELYEAAYYRHTATLDMIVDAEHPWAQDLLNHHNSEKHCHAAASIVLRIDDAIIENSVVYCRTDEKVWVLYESFRAPDRAANAFSSTSLPEVPIAEFQREDRSYLYVGSSGSFNYGHWLVDDLPRAKAWLELRRRLGLECIVLLPSYGARIDEVRVQSLRMVIDPLVEVQFIQPDRPCRIKNLYYATPVSFHPRIKNPAAIHFVRSRAMACFAHEQESAKRNLFVARRPPHSRAIANFDELWNFLAVRGFEMVEAESIDFPGQVSLFQSARIVVGQMGAAMTNTLFCQPATSLLYIAPIGWVEPFYLDLAALCGQQYNVLSGPTLQEGPAYQSDFIAPVDHLYHRLTYMGF